MAEKLLPIKLDTYKPLREIVFETIREAIISGRLPPGERLMEMQLADDLGVSRTPVREAIRKLELEGFVVMIPRKGAYVSGLSFKEIADVYEIRGALEGLAAALAAERATEQEIEDMERLLVKIAACIEEGKMDRIIELDSDFHNSLYKASHNQRLVQMISLLLEQIQRYRVTTLSHPGRARAALEEHRSILEAIAKRNVKRAQELARDHVESAEKSFLDVIRNFPGEKRGGRQ